MKQIIGFFLLVLLMAASHTLHAQRETEHWFFGKNAGLRFSGTVPNPVQVTGGQIDTPEGCSSISDSLGNLLFYTDGVSVWNKQHLRMPNGFGLKGDPSSSQSALIIKKPGNNQIYYIFTVAARAEPAGLCYSEVNMMLDGYRGNVTVKNSPLLTPATEKLTAVNHRQDNEVWVIAHRWGNNSFYTYPVTAAGIGAPVISQVGLVHAGNNDNSLGCMKASPDGTKIALAIQHSNTFELFDFDDRTGQISNPVTLTSTLFSWAYGVEFSPDGTKLYGASMGVPGMVYQFSLRHPHPDSIRNSRVFVGMSKNSLYGSMQLAPNGRLYIAAADTGLLSVIQLPNNKAGDNRFFEAGLVLTSSKSKFGLPAFNQNFFLVPSFKYEEVCFGDTMHFELRVPYKFRSVTYNFNDPASGPANTSALFNPSHYFTKPGDFNVVVTGPINNGRIRTSTTAVKVHPLPTVNLGKDIVLCPGDTARLASTGTYKKYLWSTGSEEKVLPVTEPGIYWLEVTSNFGCVDRDSIVVSLNTLPVVLSVKKEEICYGDEATFRISNSQAAVIWPDSSTGPEYKTSLAGRQPVEIKINDCTISDTIEVVYRTCPEKLFFPNIITPDNNGQNDFFLIQGIAPGTAELTIYNRYGNQVFNTKAYEHNWQAEGLPAGIYYYYVRLPEINQTFKGWVEVIK